MNVQMRLRTLLAFLLVIPFTPPSSCASDDLDGYMRADLLFASRPTVELNRMNPHVVPFADMLHPVKRSFQFGYPDSMRLGESKQVPTEIIFFKDGGSVLHSSLNLSAATNLTDWMELYKIRGSLFGRQSPLVIKLESLMDTNFTFRSDIYDPLTRRQHITRTNIKDIYANYLYDDHLREFQIGLWLRWFDEDVFHPEEHLWPNDPMLCTDYTDVPCFWRRYLLVLLSSKIDLRYSYGNLNKPQVDADLYRLDGAAAAFWFAYCKKLISRNMHNSDTYKRHCPNPCRNNPCTDMAFTISDTCTLQDAGLYESDYSCSCTAAAIWSKIKRACIVYNKCLMQNPCNMVGTDSCHFDAITRKVTCNCKDGFMGHDCSQELNACFVRGSAMASRPTGNRQCNVEAGNLCLPLKGTDQFNCECRNGWTAARMTEQVCSAGLASGKNCTVDPNCQQRPDPCMGIACEIGDCVATGAQAMCQCPVTHYGPTCSLMRGLWSIWGPWSSCDPDCGDRRVRHRVRACLGLECLGHSLESAWLVTVQPVAFTWTTLSSRVVE